MERRSIIAVVICFLVFFGWQKLYLEPRMPKPGVAIETTVAQAQPPTSAASNPIAPKVSAPQVSAPQVSAPSLASARLRVEGGEVELSRANAWLSQWTLDEYQGARQPIDLRAITHQEGQLELAFDAQELAYLSGVTGRLELLDGGAAARWTYEDDRIRIERTLAQAVSALPQTGTSAASDAQPWLTQRVRVEFKTAQAPRTAFVSLFSLSPTDDPEAQDRQFQYWSGGSVERPHLTDLSGVTETTGPAQWIAATSRYFVLGVAPTTPAKALVQALETHRGRAGLSYAVSGRTFETETRVFFVPKRLETLRAIDPTLDHTVDLGWFTIFAYPLLKLLKVLFGWVQNYGIAIILLTILVRLAVYPLAYKSAKSMKAMSRLQPQLQRIRERFKDDREALNREMLSVMRSNGYNPMAGCLPLLVQMPIFFALYRVLYGAIELYQAPFALWIHDLAAKDPYFVTPVLLTGVMYFQQRITPMATADPMQAKMLRWMPVIFGVFMLTLPAGLTLYMLTSAVVGIGQQVILNRKLGLTPLPAGAGGNGVIETSGRTVG